MGLYFILIFFIVHLSKKYKTVRVTSLVRCAGVETWVSCQISVKEQYNLNKFDLRTRLRKRIVLPIYNRGRVEYTFGENGERKKYGNGVGIVVANVKITKRRRYFHFASYQKTILLIVKNIRIHTQVRVCSQNICMCVRTYVLT